MFQTERSAAGSCIEKKQKNMVTSELQRASIKLTVSFLDFDQFLRRTCTVKGDESCLTRQTGGNGG